MLLKKKLHTRLFETSLLTVTIALFGQALVSPLADAQAGALQVWPIEVSLEGNNDVVQVNVNNTAGAETFVQAMVVAWPSSDVPGALKPTDDVMVSPPVFDLPANGSQTVRLALRRPLEGDTERTYRLVVTELAKTAGLVPNTLNVAVSMNMPVFATPQGAEAKPAWSFANTDFDGQHLVVTNEGNARLNIKKIALVRADDQKPLFESEEGGYVLAGKEKRWPLDPEFSRFEGQVIVRAETTAGQIESTISLNDS